MAPSKPTTAAAAESSEQNNLSHDDRSDQPERQQRRPLFRPEVFEAQKTKLDGEVLLIRPISFHLLSLGAMALALFLLAFLFFGSYTKTTSVSGILTPLEGLTRVFPARRGVVEKIEVRTGEYVEAGQVLMIIGHTRANGDAEDVDEKIKTQLQLSIASLEQQRRQLESMGALERERIGEKIANTRSDIETLETEVAIQEKRVLLLHEDMKGLQTLVDKKLVAEREQRQKQQELLQVQLAVKRLQRELETRRTELKTTTLDLERAPDDTAYRVAELNQSIARLQQQMIEVKAGRSTAIRAPVAGRVVTLLAEQGNEAQPERPVLKILPRGSQLEAELYVPPSAIGFVAEGHQVRIKYRAFPYQRFGTYAGRITHISDTSIAPGELITPVAINQSVYRIRVALQKQRIDTYGQSESYPLLPGMLVDAELLGSRLRIIEWLLEPIILVKGRFFS